MPLNNIVIVINRIILQHTTSIGKPEAKKIAFARILSIWYVSYPPLSLRFSIIELCFIPLTSLTLILKQTIESDSLHNSFLFFFFAAVVRTISKLTTTQTRGRGAAGGGNAPILVFVSHLYVFVFVFIIYTVLIGNSYNNDCHHFSCKLTNTLFILPLVFIFCFSSLLYLLFSPIKLRFKFKFVPHSLSACTAQYAKHSHSTHIHKQSIQREWEFRSVPNCALLTDSNAFPSAIYCIYNFESVRNILQLHERKKMCNEVKWNKKKNTSNGEREKERSDL